MNSRAAISGLERPSRASLAIWASCDLGLLAVSWPLVSTVRLRAVSPVASSSRAARWAKARGDLSPDRLRYLAMVDRVEASGACPSARLTSSRSVASLTSRRVCRSALSA